MPTGAEVTQLELKPGTSNVIDVLDQVLDKGIVIDAWARVSAAGIELVMTEARLVVTSITTDLGDPSVRVERNQPAAPKSP